MKTAIHISTEHTYAIVLVQSFTELDALPGAKQQKQLGCNFSACIMALESEQASLPFVSALQQPITKHVKPHT